MNSLPYLIVSRLLFSVFLFRETRGIPGIQASDKKIMSIAEDMMIFPCFAIIKF